MKKYFLLTILFLVACQPSSEAIEQAIVQTQSAMPTETSAPIPTLEPTPIPIPLREIDLSNVLIIDGDLPSGYSSGQIRSDPQEMFSEVKNFESVINQQFAYKGDVSGGVTIFLFDLLDDRDKAYEIIVDGFGESTSTDAITAKVDDLDEIGEKAKYVTSQTHLFGVNKENSDLAFTRCHAVVHIRMGDTSDIENLASYAERLDKRLADIICN